MLNIEVNSFMGCEEANVDIDKIALIGGLNHQGKSSFITAAACALSGQPLPNGIKKNTAHMLVKIGNTTGAVKVADSDNEISVFYPKCDVETKGSNPPATSLIAAGVDNFINFSEKERSEIIRNLLKSDPTKEDFENFLKSNGVDNEKVINEVWGRIEVDGFEATHKRHSDTGRALKQQWSVVTGESYGANKADTWSPEGWSNDLTGISLESLNADLVATQAELEGMIAQSAVDGSKKEELEAIVNGKTLEIIQNNAKICKDNSDKFSESIVKIQGLIAENKASLVGDSMTCPHCQKELQMQKGKLCAVETLSEGKKTDTEALIKKLEDDLQESINNKKLNDDKVVEYRAEYQSVKNAQAELDKINSSSSGNCSQADIDAKREKIRSINSSIKAFNDNKEATRIKTNIKENQIIIDSLDMDGIRKVAMEKGLKEFNLKLAEICDSALWSKVVIDKDLSINYDGRPYVLLSESEKYRVKVTIQICIAKLQKAEILIFDGVEILDKVGKKGFFKLVCQSEFKSIIGMMAADVEKLPCLDKFGGKTYWAENGTIK